MTPIRKAVDVNLGALAEALEKKICAACDYLDTAECHPEKCMVAFARKVLAFVLPKGVLDVPGASQLIPATDFKVYVPEDVAAALAETLRQCRECRDNHSPDCVIALTRTCLEHALTGQRIDYPGSVFLYLARLREHDPHLAELVAREVRGGSRLEAES